MSVCFRMLSVVSKSSSLTSFRDKYKNLTPIAAVAYLKRSSDCPKIKRKTYNPFTIRWAYARSGTDKINLLWLFACVFLFVALLLVLRIGCGRPRGRGNVCLIACAMWIKHMLRANVWQRDELNVQIYVDNKSTDCSIYLYVYTYYRHVGGNSVPRWSLCSVVCIGQFDGTCASLHTNLSRFVRLSWWMERDFRD